MKIARITIKAKLLGGFGLLATVVVIVSVMALNALSDANDEFSRYVNGVNARASLSAQVRTAVDRRAIAARNRPDAAGARGVRSLRDEVRDDSRARLACMPQARHVGRTRVARRIVLHATYT
ncbi:hypothetical protein WL80_04045 [Burkholderia ubonensis]|nr:hypothetical protein WL80_04045 [Burkholderia ubonensis]